MTKEFMDSVPDSVIVKKDDGKDLYVADDDTVFSLSLQDFMLTLQNSAEFYKNPTLTTMQKVLNKVVSDSIETLKADAGWYIEKVMPVFLEKEFR